MVDVTIPHGRKGPDVKQIQVHRSRNLDPTKDITTVEGIPITTWARTMLDLAATRTVTDQQLRKALDRSEEQELFDLNSLNEQFQRNHQHPGVPKLKAALANCAPPHTKSDLEELGWEVHKTRAQRAQDAANDAELELTGKRVVRLIWNDFARSPDRTERRLRLLTPNSQKPLALRSETLAA